MVKLHPVVGCSVAAFEPNRALALNGWGAFVVEPLDAEHTRVILRSRTPRGWPAVFGVLLIEAPHFVMERKMLLGIKRRTEQVFLLGQSDSSTKGGECERNDQQGCSVPAGEGRAAAIRPRFPEAGGADHH